MSTPGNDRESVTRQLFVRPQMPEVGQGTNGPTRQLSLEELAELGRQNRAQDAQSGTGAEVGSAPSPGPAFNSGSAPSSGPAFNSGPVGPQAPGSMGFGPSGPGSGPSVPGPGSGPPGPSGPGLPRAFPFAQPATPTQPHMPPAQPQQAQPAQQAQHPPPAQQPQQAQPAQQPQYVQPGQHPQPGQQPVMAQATQPGAMPVAQARKRKIPTIAIVLVALAALVFAAVGGFIIYDQMTRNGDGTSTTSPDNGQDGGQQQPAQGQGANEQPAQGGEGATDPGDVTAFMSPSANIVCTIDAQRARCTIREFDYDAGNPPDTCDVDPYGSVVVVEADNAGYSCVKRGLPTEANVLEYGSSVETHGFTCRSEEDGVTCESSQGAKFKVARAGATFG